MQTELYPSGYTFKERELRAWRVMLKAAEKINRKDIQNELITQLEKTQRHLNREYGNELIIDDLGNVQHDNCIEHCLNFAFGDCNEHHPISCENCSQIDLIFQKILNLLRMKKAK
ncbi:19790_t:CDS:2 [Entrophospora sp. SA101]|nr:19790_t:CDS:2 [Entrophospora sp. SA101]